MIKQCKKYNAFLVALIFILITVFMIIYFVFLKTPTAERIFQESIDNVVEIKASSEGIGESFGTAVLIDKDGTLISNAHVVTYKKLGQMHLFDAFQIRFSNEIEYKTVELIKYNEDLDIAVLSISSIKSKPITIGKSNKLHYGQDVYAVGNAMNYGISITKGIISNPLVEIKYEDVLRKVIQCDVVINEGNSGGALLDEWGKLIGITTFRLKDNKGSTIYGLGYCVPIDSVMEYIYQS